MNAKSVFQCLVLLSLVGCTNSVESKLVDLAGVVFIFFIVLVMMKLFSSKIFKLPVLYKFKATLNRNSKTISVILYFLSAILFIFGLLMGGIYNVLMLMSLVVLVVAKSFILSSNSELASDESKIYTEIVITGISFFFILAFMVVMKDSMFDGF